LFSDIGGQNKRFNGESKHMKKGSFHIIKIISGK